MVLDLLVAESFQMALDPFSVGAAATGAPVLVTAV